MAAMTVKKLPFKTERIWFGGEDWEPVDPAEAWEALELRFTRMDDIVSFLRAGMTVTTDFAHFRMAEDERVMPLE